MSTLQTMIATWDEQALFGLEYCTQAEDGTTVLYYTDGSTRTAVMDRRLYLDVHSLFGVWMEFPEERTGTNLAVHNKEKNHAN